MEDFFKDVFADSKHQRKVYTIIIAALITIILLLIAGLVYLSYSNQEQLKEMAENNQMALKEMSRDCNERITKILSETEFVTEYSLVTDNQSLNAGNITVNK